jgi:hypothetical protein
MGNGVIQVIIDNTSDMAITGTRVFDRGNGGTFVGPGGDALPTPGTGTTTANEWFFKTGTGAGLYRMNDDNDEWVFIAGAVATVWGAIGGTLGDQSDLQTALNGKAAAGDLSSHTGSTSNPHSVTLEQARTAGSALSGSINMNGNDLTSLRKVGFGRVQSVDASSGAAAVAFGTYQKYNVNLNNEPTVIVTWGTPSAPGNYVLTLVHGRSPSTVTFATEGAEVIYAQGGTLDVDGSASDHYVVTGYFNGTNWYMAASAAMSAIS